MVDQIVELENNRSYVILDKTVLDNRTFYYGLRLDANEEPTNNYLFFEEIKDNTDTYLDPVVDESMKGLLLTSFTVNYLNNVYDY